MNPTKELLSPNYKVMHLNSVTGVTGAQNRMSECGPAELGAHGLTGRDEPRHSVGK